MAGAALRWAPPGKFHVAGHSMGGYVALEMLRQAPERIEALALIATNARADSTESMENRKRLMATAGTDFPAVIRTQMPRLLSREHLEDRAMVSTIARMATAVGKEAFMRQQRAIIGRIDSRPHLAAIRCPTLVVAARHDAIMPVPLLEEIAAGIAGAKLAVVEESGHVIPIEQPGELNRLLLDWMKR